MPVYIRFSLAWALVWISAFVTRRMLADDLLRETHFCDFCNSLEVLLAFLFFFYLRWRYRSLDAWFVSFSAMWNSVKSLILIIHFQSFGVFCRYVAFTWKPRLRSIGTPTERLDRRHFLSNDASCRVHIRIPFDAILAEWLHYDQFGTPWIQFLWFYSSVGASQ